MTLGGSGRGRRDGVPVFGGTRAQRARNRLSHAWEQILDLWHSVGPDGEESTVGRCKVCTVLSTNELANYPCPGSNRSNQK